MSRYNRLFLFALLSVSFVCLACPSLGVSQNPNWFHQPKYPFSEKDVYDVPTTNETWGYIRMTAGDGIVGDQLKSWVDSFSQEGVGFDLTQSFVFFPIGFGVQTDWTILDGDLVPNDRVESMLLAQAVMSENQTILYGNVSQHPFMLQPVVWPYFIPGLGDVWSNGRYDDSVVMTVEILADIYMGNITNWNDSRIAELNPTLAGLLPNLTIVPIAYNSREPSTASVIRTFQRFSHRFRKAFPFMNMTDFPPVGSPNVNPNMVTCGTTFCTDVYALETPGGLGYTSIAVHNSGGQRLNKYILIDRNGTIVLPNSTNILPMYENAGLDHINALDGVEYEKEGTYPFVGEFYLFLVEDKWYVKDLCAKDRGSLMFFRWILTTNAPQEQAGKNGYIFLPKSIRDEVVQQLMEMECYGTGITLLDLEIVNDHSGSEFVAILAVCMVCMGVFPCLGLFVTLKRDGGPNGKKARFQPLAILYGIILVFGALMVYTSVIFFYLVPDHTGICETRKWLAGLGMSIFLGSVFSRTMQMHMFYRMIRKDEIASNLSMKSILKRNLIQFFVGVGIAVVTELALLIAWTVKDPFQARLSTISDITRTASWVCKSDNTWVWLGIEIGIFSCLTIYGVFVVYRSWHVSKFPEAKWLLMTVYNLLLSMCVFIPLAVTLEIKDRQVFYMASIGFTFCVSVSIFLLCLNRLGRHIENMVLRIRGSVNSRASTVKTAGTTASKATTHFSHSNDGGSNTNKESSS